MIGVHEISTSLKLRVNLPAEYGPKSVYSYNLRP
jgi:hypothetical protein